MLKQLILFPIHVALLPLIIVGEVIEFIDLYAEAAAVDANFVIAEFERDMAAWSDD